MIDVNPHSEMASRRFQVWEYQVSHGQLLIRSPKSPATADSPEYVTNLDLVCVGVEYMAVPRAFHGLVLDEPTAGELASLSAQVQRNLQCAQVLVLVSGKRRHPIVLVHYAIAENDWDIFESPFQFRSQFRASE